MIGLVYLIWPPLGPVPVREFLGSYRAKFAGAEHELIMLLNGDVGQVEAIEQELCGVQHRMVVLKNPRQDLAAYGEAALLLEHDRLCFVNSYSVVLTDDWLGRLTRALDEPGVGISGASGSWESHAEWIRGPFSRWPRQLAKLPRWRRDFPRFPNPHLRTSAFAIQRDLMLRIGPESVRDKHSAYMLESGRTSITRQVLGRGMRAVVVGRDGRSYDIDEWPDSGTFRSKGQVNLLVSDNRTRDWERASSRVRRRQAHDAWGSRADV
jgi:hypothetical protein